MNEFFSYNQHLHPGVELHSSNYTYIINKVLGQGSFGITYLATTRVMVKASIEGALGKLQQDRWEEVQVAIKEFFMRETNSRRNESSLVEGSDSQLTRNYRKKFRREAENLSSLNHPNIVKVLEVFDANNTSYYVMEYIKGKNLDECIPPDGMNEKEARRIITDIAQGLQYMHSHRMLHLDIKPKNIMIAQDGKAKLIDFGLSKQYNENDEPESSTSIGLGTPGYAPLEQSNYKQDGTFPATLDIYALGATYYKMLTGKTPPPASDVLDDGLPPLPSRLSLESVKAIDAAMEPRKKNRVQDVDAWLALLGEDGNAEETRVDESVLTASRSESIYEMMTASLPTHHGTIGKTTSPSQATGKTRVMAIPEHLRHLMDSGNTESHQEIVANKPDAMTEQAKPVAGQDKIAEKLSSEVVGESNSLPKEPEPLGERPKNLSTLNMPKASVTKPVESKTEDSNPFIRFLLGLVATLAFIGVVAFIYNAITNEDEFEEEYNFTETVADTSPIVEAENETSKPQPKGKQTNNEKEQVLATTVNKPTVNQQKEVKEDKSEQAVAPKEEEIKHEEKPTDTNTPSSAKSQQKEEEVTKNNEEAARKSVLDKMINNMIFVRDGTFKMGSRTRQHDGSEKPRHTVTLSKSFYIGKYEVTQEEWVALMGNNPSKYRGRNLPVNYVSWKDCQEFIKRLNAYYNTDIYRLPTEAEWEFAAKGGNLSKNYKYAGSNKFNDVAWVYKNSNYQPGIVGTRKPNELGIYDMTGNVQEWVNDRFGTYDSADQTDPSGASTGNTRVIRGLSFESLAIDDYVNYNIVRYNKPEDYKHHTLGFRLVATIK